MSVLTVFGHTLWPQQWPKKGCTLTSIKINEIAHHLKKATKINKIVGVKGVLRGGGGLVLVKAFNTFNDRPLIDE